MSASPLLCGPLLRYTNIDYSVPLWNGSLLLVLGDAPPPSPLRLFIQNAQTELAASTPQNIFFENGHSFWRYSISLPLADTEQMIQYSIGNPQVQGSFSVPAKDENMRIMFHSCNGFSVKIPDDAFAGPALWNDVLICLVHKNHPFHVMIGGGDQIYSDRVFVDGPLKAWSKEKRPRRKARTPFTPQLSRDLDNWYFTNYLSWYTTSPFREASASIPSIQIWDDHDIIDGYGSYEDRFMRTPIFLGIGAIAHKYYCLFQHHIAPAEIESAPDPSFVVGAEKGPYIHARAFSLCSNLGPRTMFYGLDCRVERTRHRICYQSSYDAMFDRLEMDIRKGTTKHVLVLLGVPIAYPRLVWLEGLLSSKLLTAPIKLASKLFGWGDGMFNKFDGSSELLDDLDDHWCSMHHKRERNEFVRRLQGFAADKQVRITILSGDVHLAAVGRFFSPPRFNIPQNKDPRYMVNVVSSAITNAPPPPAVAKLMHKQNRIHFLDRHTHENLMDLFREDSEGKRRKASSTMPARNYAIITEHAGLAAQIAEANRSLTQNGDGADVANGDTNELHTDLRIAKTERGGTVEQNISAATPATGTTRPFSLDVAFRVELDQKDPEGRTMAYGFSIPALED
ncbi:hypothetical protein BU17DRAFT_58930 [Hysterangium stoloniferum]|nr:hypothetical protein BU17DRAFT_58930 [Hysterangium stoloniferum]